ncbi:MAG: hypothetical protein DRQ98_03410, partial [Gammaproteobacteria bacterium]
LYSMLVDLHLNLTRTLYRIMHHWLAAIPLCGKAFLALKRIKLACRYPLKLNQILVVPGEFLIHQ